MKKIISLLVIFSFIYSTTNTFQSYEYEIFTNENGDVTLIQFDWWEFLKLSEELSELRIIKTNAIAYIKKDDILIKSEKKIDKFEKKTTFKKQARNIVIVTIISLITGFFTGLNLNISR